MFLMKKGNGSVYSLLILITLICGAAAGIILGTIIFRFPSSETAEYTFLAKDTAILIDAILSMPQDVQLVYPQEFVKGYIRLEDDSISIFPTQPGPNQSSLINYPFIPRRDVEMIEEDLRLSTLYFIKENNTIRLDNKPSREIIEEVEE